MNTFVNFRPRVVPNRCVRVVRKIKGSGTLSVVKNQEVSPHDVLGDSQISAGFSIINLSKDLKLPPADAIKAIKKSVGVPIYKGELLAQKKGLFGSKNIIAPTDCLIEKTNAQTGELILKMLPKKLPLLSGVFGIVDEINTLTGEVYIKTMATQIIGICGSGRERGGFLRFMGGPSDLVNANQILPSMKGDILVAGGLVFGMAMKKAMEYQIDGLISGGINMDDYVSITGSLYEPHQSHSDIGISLLATEGFGALPIGQDIIQTLKKFEGKFVFINGFASHLTLPESTADVIVQARKISLPFPAGLGNPNPEIKPVILPVGAKVRIIWPPFAGNQGLVVQIDQSPTLLPSGISTGCAVVELSSRKIKVPINNLELLQLP